MSYVTNRSFFQKNISFFKTVSLAGKRLLLVLPLFLFVFSTGCMTSSSQDEMQSQIDSLKTQLKARDQQISSTTQAALDSQSSVQTVQDQLRLTQGALDELTVRVKHIEQTAGANTQASQNTVAIESNENNLDSVRRQIARLDLLNTAGLPTQRRGKLPAKIKNLATLDKTLLAAFNEGNLKHVLELSMAVLNATQASNAMLAAALEYRAEAKFKMKDYRGSAIDFSSYVEKYPTGRKYARALLLAGDSYVYLGQETVARSYYQECATSYPKLPEGQAAAERLGSLMTQQQKGSQSGEAAGQNSRGK